MACAVARASLKVIVEERLADRSAELGTLFLNRLKQINSPHIVEIRGRGLWIAIELTTPARPICEALMREGILAKETHDNIIRFAPPLIIEKEELLWAADRLQHVLDRL